MSLTLTVLELYADIGKDELDGLSGQLIEAGQLDPVVKEIADSLELINFYINPYSVTDIMVKRIWRLLAISGLYNRLGRITDKRQTERDWCMKTLAEIRDGKFKNLAIDTTILPITAVAWGGSTAVEFNPDNF